MKTARQMWTELHEHAWDVSHLRTHARIVTRCDATTRGAFEHAILSMIDGLITYVDAHNKAYESPVGDDYVIGPAVQLMVSAIRDLLNGETGRLDCGTLDSFLITVSRNFALEEG